MASFRTHTGVRGPWGQRASYATLALHATARPGHISDHRHTHRKLPNLLPIGDKYGFNSSVTILAPADAEDETFELVDEAGRVVGTAPRGDCHARGLLHKSVFCWVMDPEGNILLQQRSLAKKLGRGQWDLSVAEHLQPGEEYAEVRSELGGRCWAMARTRS